MLFFSHCKFAPVSLTMNLLRSIHCITYLYVSFHLQGDMNLLMKYNFQGQVLCLVCVRKDKPECVYFYHIYSSFYQEFLGRKRFLAFPTKILAFQSCIEGCSEKEAWYPFLVTLFKASFSTQSFRMFYHLESEHPYRLSQRFRWVFILFDRMKTWVWREGLKNPKSVHCTSDEVNFRFRMKAEVQYSLTNIYHLNRNVKVKELHGWQSLIPCLLKKKSI